MDVSNRRLHVRLTQEAKIASEFLLYQGNFRVCGIYQRSKRLPSRDGSRS